MERKLFGDLVQSVMQAKAISKGKAKASRRFRVDNTDVKAIRECIGLMQDEFAKLMRLGIKTLQNGEQQRRQPTGSTAALLKIVSTSPQLTLESFDR